MRKFNKILRELYGDYAIIKSSGFTCSQYIENKLENKVKGNVLKGFRLKHA